MPLLRNAFTSLGVRDWDNLWDATIDTTNEWTLTGANNGNGSYGHSESNGALACWANAFGATGSFFANAQAVTKRSFKPYPRVTFFAMLTAHGYMQTASDKSNHSSYLTLTDGGANNVTLASVVGVNPVIASTNFPGGIGVMIGLLNDGTNITVRVRSEQQGGTVITCYVIPDNTVVNIGSWANVYLKLDVQANDNGISGSGQASIGPIMLVDHWLGSKGTV